MLEEDGRSCEAFQSFRPEGRFPRFSDGQVSYISLALGCRRRRHMRFAVPRTARLLRPLLFSQVAVPRRAPCLISLPSPRVAQPQQSVAQLKPAGIRRQDLG